MVCWRLCFNETESEEWGSKVVAQLSEYIRSNRPDIKGFSKRNIYNMVMFMMNIHLKFCCSYKKYMTDKFVQSETAQIGFKQGEAITVQSQIGQMPDILALTTLTNHIEILCRCKV